MATRLAHLDRRCTGPGAVRAPQMRRDAGPLSQPASTAPAAIHDHSAPPPASATPDWALPHPPAPARAMTLSSGWSFPAAADYEPAAPSLSLGAPVTLVADEPADSAPSIATKPIDRDDPVPSPALWAEDVTFAPPDPAPDPVDEAWSARLSGQTVSTEPLSEGQSAAGHDIFDRMGRSRQQTLAYSLGRFDIDEHLRALETAMSVDARIAAGQPSGVAAEAQAMGDFDLLAEIASLAAEHAAAQEEDNEDEAVAATGSVPPVPAPAPPPTAQPATEKEAEGEGALPHAAPAGDATAGEAHAVRAEETHDVTVIAEREGDEPPRVAVTVDGEAVDPDALQDRAEPQTRDEETNDGDTTD